MIGMVTNIFTISTFFVDLLNDVTKYFMETKHNYTQYYHSIRAIYQIHDM